MLTLLETDRSIIRKVLRGHTDRFGVLVDRYGGLVYAIAYAYLRSREDAEDVVQETYTRLYQRLDDLPLKRSIGPWLAQVARNVAIDRLRKRVHEVPVPHDAAAGTHDPNPARDEIRRLVVEELGRLDMPDREVLVLHYFLGKKAREIAELLDIQPEAAAKRLQRARDELGRRLVDVLKDDLAEEQADANRRRRVLAAIAVAPVPWKACAAASVAVTALTGASTLKVMLSIAGLLALIIAGLLAALMLWHPRLPFFAPKIAATTEYVVETAAPAESAVARAKDAASVEAAPAEETTVVAAGGHAGTALSGIVLTEGGQPVPGAKVFIDNTVNAKWWAVRRKGDPETKEIAPLRMTTLTDEAGRFRFASIPCTLDHPYDNYLVAATTDNLYGNTIFHAMPELAEEIVELTVRPSAALGGIVTDTAGKPIEDAWVVLKELRRTDEGQPFGLPPLWTDADGRFLFEHVMLGEYKFEVQARGYLNTLTDWIRSGNRQVAIQLDSGNSISGRVTEAGSGTPVAEEQVLALGADNMSRAFTESDGRFVITGLKSGKYWMRCRKVSVPPDPYMLPAPMVVTLAEDRPVTNLEIKVVRGAELRGRVIDTTTGAPIPEATLTFKGRLPDVPEGEAHDAGPIQTAYTDSDGRYEASGLPPGSLELVAQAKTYDEKSLTVSVPAYGQVATVDLQLQAMPSVRGAVTDADGKPVADAGVMAIYAADSAGPWPDAVVSDAAGAFQLMLPKKQDVRLQAVSRGRISPVSEAVTPGATGITLELIGAGKIEGTVVDSSGSPVGRARVRVMPADAAAQQRIAFQWDGRSRTIAEGPETTYWSCADGSFRTGPILPGYYTLTVLVPGARGSSGTTRAYVREHQTLRTRLQIDTRDCGAIEGVVTINGKPGKQMWMHAEVSGVGGGNGTSTGQDGHYRIFPVPTGSATVTLYLDMQETKQEQTVDVSAGKTATVNFDVMTANTTVEGTVRVNGQPVAGAAVSLTPVNPSATQQQAKVPTDAEGQFRIEGLDEGDYTCEVVALNNVLARPEFVLRDARDVHVADGKTTRVDFDLAGAAIEGAVSGLAQGERAYVLLFTGDADLPELSPAAIAALEEKAIAQAVVYERDGRFQFYGLTPGNYVLAVVAVPTASGLDEDTALRSLTAGRYAVLQIQAPPGEPVSADLALPH